MTHFFKIREDRKSNYSGIKAFLEHPASLNPKNISKDGVYYCWRLAPGHQDTMVVTKIKLEDLVLVSVYE